MMLKIWFCIQFWTLNPKLFTLNLLFANIFFYALNLFVNVCSPFKLVGCKQDNKNHTCLLFDRFCDCFLENILTIFWECFWKNLQKNLLMLEFFFILFYFYVKIMAKNVIFKKIKSIYESFYCLKVNVIMFNECFC
jgi:hypothetical protein